jgi:hypothetical protein
MLMTASNQRAPGGDTEANRERADGDGDKVAPVPDAATEFRGAPSAVGSNLRKDPEDWKTGDETMTDAQRSYLQTLSDEAGEAFDSTLTKAEASKRIEELQRRTGRGVTR